MTMTKDGVIRILLVLLPLLILIGVKPPVLSAQHDPRFVHYSTSDGLPSNRITVLAGDQEGFLWAGTRNGLARYDGYRFTAFAEMQPAAGLPEEEVSLLLVDKNQGLWVKYLSGKLYRLDLRTYRPEKFEVTFLNQTPGAYNSSWEDEQGDIWFAASNGLAKYRQKDRQFQHFPLSWQGKDVPVTQFCKGENGNLWISGDRGIFRFDTKTHTCMPERGLQGIDNGGLSIIASDNEGLLWLSNWGGKDRGLMLYDPHQKKILERFTARPDDPNSLTNTDMNWIFPDGDSIWLATNSGGLCLFDKKQKHFRRFVADPKNQTSFWLDQISYVTKNLFGNLWIGSSYLLYQVPAGQKTTTLLTHNPYNPNSLINRGGGTLLKLTDTLLAIGTWEGLSIYNRMRQTFHNIDLPIKKANNHDACVNAMARADHETFWVGTWMGLFRIDRRTGAAREQYITGK